MNDAIIPRPRRRWGRWVFLAVQVLMLIWVISAGASAGHPTNCGVLDHQTCVSADNAGHGIAVVLLIFLWAALDVIIGVTVLIMRKVRTTN